jgi:hypothetical protein
VCTVLFALALVGFCSVLAKSKPVPRQMKLGPVAQGHQSLSAFWPYGRAHALVLGVPGGERNQPPEFSGFIKIDDGNGSTTTLLVNSTNAVPCNWLHSPDVQGFILTWQNTNNWKSALLPGRTYSVTCDFTGNIPSNSTLWISCVQTWTDHRKTERKRTRP